MTTKTKAAMTKGATLEAMDAMDARDARIARLLEKILADGLEAIRQHVHAEFGDGPLIPERALSLADLCVELARLQTALIKSETQTGRRPEASPANENARTY